MSLLVLVYLGYHGGLGKLDTHTRHHGLGYTKVIKNLQLYISHQIRPYVTQV